MGVETVWWWGLGFEVVKGAKEDWRRQIRGERSLLERLGGGDRGAICVIFHWSVGFLARYVEDLLSLVWRRTLHPSPDVQNEA